MARPKGSKNKTGIAKEKKPELTFQSFIGKAFLSCGISRSLGGTYLAKAFRDLPKGMLFYCGEREPNANELEPQWHKSGPIEEESLSKRAKDHLEATRVWVLKDVWNWRSNARPAGSTEEAGSRPLPEGAASGPSPSESPSSPEPSASPATSRGRPRNPKTKRSK